ncbi:uncharacterized protein [Chironomus tepperi]|uniref:uncharacterized protein isoform X4 n=1 Tax=Chironomus tepperi TaxID=113505 RepID=UPI00391F531E
MYSATSYKSGAYDEDFVMTPIKCPPPKIVAVKRSLKRKKKNILKNIMDDDDDSDVKDEIMSVESFDDSDAKDLIEFEKEEPLIDLSDENIQDTVKDMNVKNSNSSTITMLLDLLEIGSIITSSSKNETAIVGSCAEDDDYDILPTLEKQKKISSSSSSLNELPLESTSACAHVDTGKTDLSSIPSLPQPLSAIQPENPSIVRKYSICLEKLKEFDDKSSQKLSESDLESEDKVLKGIDKSFIDFERLQKKFTKKEPEEEKSSIFTSILRKSSCVNESSKILCCSNNDCSTSSCINSDKFLKTQSSSSLTLKVQEDNDQKIFNTDLIVKEDKEKEEVVQQQQLQYNNNNSAQLINSLGQESKVVVEVEESSDKNNNRESVCNQNFSLSSKSSDDCDGKVLKDVEGELRDKATVSFDFLSSKTSQRKLPPKFYSSTTSLNQDSCFEASTRLKRLEERFKGFSYTKKLLRSSKVFSKSEEILSSVGKDIEFKSQFYSGCNTTDSLNSTSLLQFPLTTSSTLSDNSLRYECDNNELNYGTTSKLLINDVSLDREFTPTESKNNNNNNNNRSKTLEDIKFEDKNLLPSLLPAATNNDTSLQRLQSPESSTESDEICKIFRDKDIACDDEDIVNNNKSVNTSVEHNNNNSADHEIIDCDEDCSFVYYEEDPGDRSVSICEDDEELHDKLIHSIFNDISFSNCEFDVQTFHKFLKDSIEDKSNHEHNSEDEDDDDDLKSDESDFFCDCLVEAVPLYHQTSTNNNINMRETGAGKLRGLLKQPNRPPPTRKNRVVFDETRNEFFEADYIILIREDCPYDEEDEEPCTCGDHELVRICCDEGCNCGYTDVDDGRTPPSPKFAPPIEFVDQATLSPPEGYKDGSLLDSALSDALSNHVFGAQHIQQLQVIQRLQQQRAAMLAARAAASSQQQQPQTTQQQQQPIQQQQQQQQQIQQIPQQQQQQIQQQQIQQQQIQQQNVIIDPQQQAEICPECTQCSECAAAKLAELEAGAECDSQCSEEASPMEVAPPPHVLTIASLVPVQKSSPERRNQKEIVAGEERPKFLTTTTKTEDSQAVDNVIPEAKQTSYVVETITTTMTTVTEHTIIQTAEDSDQPPPKPPKAVTLQPPALPEGRSSIYASSQSVENMKNDLNATIIPKFNVNGTAQAITGILKGGKLRKTDSIQNDETNNTTSDEETSSRRSVRFNEESESENQTTESNATDDDGKPKSEQLTDYVTHMSLKRHSSLFHNALRPNSAVRQLFPAKSPPSALTAEALKAFEESKRSGNLLTASQTITSAGSSSSTSTSPTPLSQVSSSDTDTLIKRSIERNALRRSLIKYEPKKKVVAKESTSLEERIRQLTCDIDEPLDNEGNSPNNINELERRDSPAGEETPQQVKFDKSFSPSSSASSSSSCSTGSTYKKITDLFNKEKRQEKIPETDENPIVIQDCRCGPDLGIGVQIQQTGHSHHPPPPPPRSETTKRQFNTLASLTACVAGQRDDFSYYIASKPGDRTSTASSQTGDQYSIGDIDAALQDGDGKKVAPDVIAGTPMNCTPGQEQDELVSFAQQEANRMDRIKKRYSSDSAPASGVNSDDDEQNDYGFNKRPSVRGIKPRFGSTNEILQQMQDQLSQPNVQTTTTVNNQAVNNNNSGNQIQSNTLPRTNAAGQLQIANAKQQQQQQPQQPQQGAHQHQHTGSWSYYPQQATQDQQGGKKVTGDAYGNYYHLPAHARHSYHGEAIYQNCHTMTVQQTQQAIIPGHIHQKIIQQPHAAAIHAIQHAQQINRFSHFARSPTRRPESPPPLRNYHQMVLIPYKSDANGTYTAYGIAGEGGGENNIYQRQLVEFQQVTQQTIRVPVGWNPIPGMQLHVVRPNSATPHYATLPRQNSSSGVGPTPTNKFMYTDKPLETRGVPEGEASTGQQTDCINNIIPSSQDGESNNNNPAGGTVFYAMNI